MIPSIEQLLAGDENVSPSFRRLFATPKPDLLDVAHDKASPRRFTGEPVTDYGSLPDFTPERRREIWDRESADQMRDEREERIARGD